MTVALRPETVERIRRTDDHRPARGWVVDHRVDPNQPKWSGWNDPRDEELKL